MGEENEKKINQNKSWQDKITQLYKHDLSNGDITIQVSKDDVTKSFKAHRLVLEMSSDFLKTQLQESKGNEISFQDINPEEFALFLEFVYCKNIKLISVKQAIALYKMANFFHTDDLNAYCASYIEKSVDYATLFECLNFSENFDNDRLKSVNNECYNIIKRDTKEVLESINIDGFSKDSLMKILSQETLSISELELFVFCEKWFNANCPNKDDCFQEEEDSPIQKLRFLSMSADEFVETPGKSGLLSVEQCLGILGNMLSEDSPWEYPKGFDQSKRLKTLKSNYHSLIVSTRSEGPFSFNSPKRKN